MNKLLCNLSCLVALFFGMNLAAQTIPNSGFETWVNNTESGSNYLVPQAWIPVDMLDRAFNSSYTGAAVVKTTQSHSGSAAALMQTVVSGGDTTSGILFSVNSMAELASSLFSGTGMGFGCTSRPANLTGFYKLNSLSGDYAVVSVVLTKWNTSLNKRDTLGFGTTSFMNTVASYTSFSAPITYTLNLFPDTALIIAGLQATTTTHVGSTFFLDDLAFTGIAPFDVRQFQQEIEYVSICPNPFCHNARFRIDASLALSGAQIIISDVLGKEVRKIDNLSHETTMERGDLLPGIYFYRLVGKGNILANGRFVIE